MRKDWLSQLINTSDASGDNYAKQLTTAKCAEATLHWQCKLLKATKYAKTTFP